MAEHKDLAPGREDGARSDPHLSDKLLLTPREAAYLLSISRTVVFRLMKRRQLFSVNIDGARRIPHHALHAFVDGLIASRE
jgi:excisionase family DNA binding protein